jgi:hypothetical protein
VVKAAATNSNGIITAAVQKTVQLCLSDGNAVSLWAYILAVRSDAGQAVHIAIMSLRDPKDTSACVTQRFLEPNTPASFPVAACGKPVRMRFMSGDGMGSTKDILISKIRHQDVHFGLVSFRVSSIAPCRNAHPLS